MGQTERRRRTEDGGERNFIKVRQTRKQMGQTEEGDGQKTEERNFLKGRNMSKT